MARQRGRVLVVEDDPDIQQLIEVAIERAGHEVVLAGTGDHGWELLLAGGHDLLVVDWMLPGPSGLEIAGWCRAHPDLHDLPILMLTARAMPEDVHAGLEAGVTRYLTKPFSPRGLARLVDEVLGNG